MSKPSSKQVQDEIIAAEELLRKLKAPSKTDKDYALSAILYVLKNELTEEEAHDEFAHGTDEAFYAGVHAANWLAGRKTESPTTQFT